MADYGKIIRKLVIANLIIANLIVLIMIFNALPHFNSKLILELNPNYNIGEKLGGNAIVTIQSGDEIQKDTGMMIKLSRDGKFLQETRFTFSEFLAIKPVLMNKTKQICNDGESITREVCHNEIIENCASSVQEACVDSFQEVCHDETSQSCHDETADEITTQVCEDVVNQVCESQPSQVCINQTIENCNDEEVQVCINQTETQQNCFDETIEDYWFNQLGSYSKNIEKIIEYRFESAGNYLIEFSVPSMNVSASRKIEVLGEINETETSLNESEENITSIIKDNLTIQTKKYKIVINRPVKWQKKILGDIENASIELPKEAENISIKTGSEIREAEQNALSEERIIEENKEALISGRLSLEIETKKPGILVRLWKWLTKSKVTGNAVSEQEIQDAVSETANEKIINLDGIGEVKNEEEILVEYYTDAPHAVEENITNGKEITISAPDELNYSDVLAYSELDNRVLMSEKSKIKLYHIGNGSREETQFDAYDLDSDSKIDYIEWNIPHLSEQVYQIIYITKAERLDSSRNFVEDIYDKVKAQDGNYSTINAGEYVRATFEVPLDNSKDITLYSHATISGVEIYTENGNEVIARLDNLAEGNNRVILSGLQGTSQVFDLKFLGDTEVDYIVDPSFGTLQIISDTNYDIISNTPTVRTFGGFRFVDTSSFGQTYGGCWYSFNNGVTNSTCNCTFLGMSFSPVGNAWRAENDSNVLPNQGLNNVIVYANDSTGQIGSQIGSFTYDSVAPVLGFNCPIASQYYSEASWLTCAGVDARTCTDTGGSGCDTATTDYFTLNGGANWYALMTATSLSDVTAYLVEGNNTLQVKTDDYAGNTGYSNNITFTYDTTAPNVAITYPTEGISATSSTWAANFAYTYGDASTCSYSWDGSSYTAFSSCGQTDSITPPAEGANTLYIQGIDGASNTNTTSVNFIYDNYAPVIKLISPANGSGISSGNFVYNVTDSSATNCSLIMDNAAVNFNSSVNINGGNNLFVNSTTSGNHTWKVNCTDAANYKASSSTRTFYYSNLIVSLIGATATSVSYNATDNKNITSCSLIVGSSLVATDNAVNNSGGNETLSYNFPDGTHSYYVTCIDNISVGANSSTGTITIATNTVTVTTSGGGGGGTAKHYLLKILTPGELSISDSDTFEVPVTIQNLGNTAMKGITLTSKVTFNELATEDIRAVLGKEYIEQLAPGKAENLTITIYANLKKQGKYKITLYAEVKEPKISDFADFFIDMRKINATEAEQNMIFAEKLIEDNEKCSELMELVNEAKKAYDSDEFRVAFVKAKEAVDACNVLLGKSETPKARVNYSMIMYVSAFSSLVFVIIGMIIYIYRRAKKFRKRGY